MTFRKSRYGLTMRRSQTELSSPCALPAIRETPSYWYLWRWLGLLDLSRACVSGFGGHRNRAKPMQGPGLPPFAPAFSPRIDLLVAAFAMTEATASPNQSSAPTRHRPLASALAPAIALRANERRHPPRQKPPRANEQSTCLPSSLCSQGDGG